MTTVISGPGQPHIGKELAEMLGADHIEVRHKFFPDGERDMILAKEECAEETIIVQSIIPPQDTNLISLMQLAYTAEEFGAKEITLVTPYLAYVAKDRRILKGEVVSVFNIFRMIQATPANSLYVIDIHNPKVFAGKKGFFHDLSAMPEFGKYYLEKELENPLVLAPDQGAKRYAVTISQVLDAPFDQFEKKRDPVTGKTQIFPHKIDLKGRDVIIADESIRTGGTIVKAIQALKAMDAGRIFVAATHLLLVNTADKKILEAGAEELIGTDSLPSKYSKIPVAPLIKRELEKD